MPRRRLPAGPPPPMTSVADDLAVMSTDADSFERKRYVSRGRRPSTSTRTTSDYDWETSSTVEDVIAHLTSTEEKVFVRASPTGQDAGTTADWLTAEETAEAMPENAVSIATEETVSANAMRIATAHKERTHPHTTAETATTTRHYRSGHHHHLWGSITNEMETLPPATKRGPSNSTVSIGHVTTASARQMRKIIAAVTAKRNFTTVRTTPSVGGKHRPEKKTDRTMKASSVRPEKETKAKARTLVTTGRTVKGHKIATVRTVKGHKIVGGSKTRNSQTVEAKTVKAFSIKLKTTGEQVS
ncbi:hypothetical protein V5799_032156 [Amblyomma americanum]|uniref:Uncharacterized protein n=1 Tax=Amblyomma americanum TaxID=6943 RepID=A0AAQ4DRZ2_AMBAM